MTTEPLVRHKVPIIAIACACVIALLAFGPRSAMGFFQLPILQDNAWDRATFGMAMALQNLFWGIGQPLFGVVADKFGTWRVLAVGAVLYALGLVLMAIAPSPVWLHIGGGILIGLGVAACSFGVVLASIARLVSPEKRSFAFGLGTAAGSAGMFVFAPISQGLIDNLGWSDSLIAIGIFMLIIPLLAIPLRGNSSTSKIAAAEFEQTVRQSLQEAFASRGYLLLTAGFFVCGFQVAFITAHFPAYISDLGIAAKWAVVAISLIGFFNIIGSLASGVIGQRYSKPIFLSLIYIGRSIAFTAFLLIPQTPTTVVVFSIVIGILWLSTVAPTNALFPPAGFVPRRLDGRRTLRIHRQLRHRLVARSSVRHLRRRGPLAHPRRTGAAPRPRDCLASNFTPANVAVVRGCRWRHSRLTGWPTTP
jgi:MFS family permease